MAKLYVVGFGPGNAEYFTQQAHQIISDVDIVVGYTVYIHLMRQVFPDKEYIGTSMKQEVERCHMALRAATDGKTVAFVCSGDAGVYGMAGLVLELAAGYDNVEVEIIPGMTAATSGAAVLGAPLMHDFAVISLSDLLTPWEKIEKRLKCAAQGDYVICLYNPSSKKRADYLKKACEIVMKYQREDIVCGYVQNIGREGERAVCLTLKELKDTTVDMFTTVYIGNSQTKNINGKMVTPRGYRI